MANAGNAAMLAVVLTTIVPYANTRGAMCLKQGCHHRSVPARGLIKADVA